MIQKIRNGAALAWVVACALWVLVNDGVSGLFGATILALFVFSMFSRKGGRERQDAEFDVPRFGPTDRQKLQTYLSLEYFQRQKIRYQP